VESPVAQHGAIGSALENGLSVVEEAAAAQPVSMRQRGTRLSFLGGRRRESKESNGDAMIANGELNIINNNNNDTASHGGRSRDSKDLGRRSLFRAKSSDVNIAAHLGNGHHYGESKPSVESNHGQPQPVPSSTPRKSNEVIGVYEKHAGPDKEFDAAGLNKVGSVRKRLSMLKLGRKTSKLNGTMGGVEEQ
jgi:dedicator of cytokinesis protein 3